MLTLCGSPISNYYNKVKLALLEKGVGFTEELVPIMSKSEAVLADSPLGKIPYVRTPQGGYFVATYFVATYFVIGSPRAVHWVKPPANDMTR